MHGSYGFLFDWDKDIQIVTLNVFKHATKINSPKTPEEDVKIKTQEQRRYFTDSATNPAKSFTSSSVVSNEHIQRTMHSSSIHG